MRIAPSVRHQPSTPTAPSRRAKGEATIRAGKLGMGPELRGRLTNVSTTGAVLSMLCEPPIGVEVALELTAPGRGGGLKAAGVFESATRADDGLWHVDCRFERPVTYHDLRDLLR